MILFPPVLILPRLKTHIKTQQDHARGTLQYGKVDGLKPAIAARGDIGGIGTPGRFRFKRNVVQAKFFGGVRVQCPAFARKIGAPFEFVPPIAISGVQNIGPRGHVAAFFDGVHAALATAIINIFLGE